MTSEATPIFNPRLWATDDLRRITYLERAALNATVRPTPQQVAYVRLLETTLAERI